MSLMRTIFSGDGGGGALWLSASVRMQGPWSKTDIEDQIYSISNLSNPP